MRESCSGDVQLFPGDWQLLQQHPARGARMQNSTRTSTTDAFPNPWPMLIHWESNRTYTTDAFPSSGDRSCAWNRTRTTTTDAFPTCAPRGGSWHLGKCARTHTTDTFSACAPRMQCVVLRVDIQKLYDRSISHMMCVWCKGYCRPGSAPALSPYCVLENT